MLAWSLVDSKSAVIGSTEAWFYSAQAKLMVCWFSNGNRPERAG
jgi:hypothetical protein